MRSTVLRGLRVAAPAIAVACVATVAAEEVKDPETGAVVRQLSHGPQHNKHAYYDISPWSPDGRSIVYSSALPGETTGVLMLMDADAGSATRLTDATYFNEHTGAYPQWHPDGQRVVYRPAGKDLSTYAFLEIETRQIEYRLARHLRLSPDGQQIAYFEGEDLAVMNTDGSQRRVVATLQTVAAMCAHREDIRASPAHLKAPRWSPDGRKLMVAFSNEGADKQMTVKELYVVFADGSGLRRVCDFRHHAVWHPSGTQVLFVAADGIGLIDEDGSGRRVVCELAQGHPTFNPQATLIVTDVNSGAYKDSLVLIEPATGEVRKLVNCPATQERGRGRGTHLHPVWSADGTQILYDCDRTGTSQIYVVDVPAWESLPRSE